MLGKVASWSARGRNSRSTGQLGMWGLAFRKFNLLPWHRSARSEAVEERLGTGAVIQELSLRTDRLHFRTAPFNTRLTGQS